MTATRLADCVQLMRADLLFANPTPENAGRPVSDVLMYDPLDEWDSVAGRMILAVGLTVGSAGFDELLSRAADSDAAAVIVKAHGTPIDQLRSAAVRHSLAVLVAPDQADWTRLAALARASVDGAAADAVSGVRLGDLYAFANAVASITDGATSIVDPLGRILGYSTLPGQPIDEVRRVTTLALHETTLPALDKDFATAYSSPGAILIPETQQGLSRLALAVRAGGELLGSMWVIDPGEHQREAALEALDRMAPLAGLHMLHARTAADFGQRRNADLVRTLMEDPDHASFVAAQLGVEAAAGLAVAVFTIARPVSGSLEAVRELHRLLHLVTTVCSLQFTASHSALIDSIVYAVLPCQEAAPRAVHRRAVQEIGSHADTISSYPIIAAVGAIAPRLEDLPASRAGALQTLEYLRHLRSVPSDSEKGSVVALVEDHHIPLNLMTVGAFLEENGLAGSDDIAAIQARDTDQQTDYLQTLRAYFATNGNISAMASRLHVHNNTVRYRVAQLEKSVGLDDPQKRLWLWLRLATMDLRA